MQARLPRELRDMVYAFLWADTDCKSMSKYVGRKCCRRGTVATGHRPRCAGYESFPHFIEPEFVGCETAREVVEAWYISMHMRRDHAFVDILTMELEYILSVDTFLVGLEPASVLRCLRLEIMVNDPDLLDLRGYLQQLMAVRLKKGFRLDMMLQQRAVRMKVLCEVLGVMRLTLRECVDQGACVRVCWQHNKSDMEERGNGLSVEILLDLVLQKHGDA